MLAVPQALLDDRRRKELDKTDELWDRVLHMTRPASDAHQALALDLLMVLVPLASAQGLVSRYETGCTARPATAAGRLTITWQDGSAAI